MTCLTEARQKNVNPTISCIGTRVLERCKQRLLRQLLCCADKCVLDSCRYMQQRGWDVTYLPVKSDGLVDLDQLRDAIRPDTAIVSVMYVNNEIGESSPH